MLIQRKTLLDVLNAAAKAVSKRPGIPALTGALLKAERDGLTVTATDLELTYRATVPGVEDDHPWAALPPLTQLKELIRKATDDTVEIYLAASGDFVVVSTMGLVTLRCLPIEDYPTIEEITGVNVAIHSAETNRVLNGTIPFASTDEARPTMTGVSIEVGDGRLVACATDSYTMGVAYESAVADGTAHVLVPARALKLVEAATRRYTEPVRIVIGKAATAWFVAGAEYQVRSIEGQFPNWQQLLPDDVPNVLVFERDAIEGVVTGMEAMLKGASTPIRFDLHTESSAVSCEAPDLGSIQQAVPGVFAGASPIQVAYNASYFLRCLRATKADSMGVLDGLKPSVFAAPDEQGFALLMPVRLPAPVGEAA